MDRDDFAATQYGVIGAAVSGGVDSMCLLHYLVHSGAKVMALTVEHGIRGEQSKQDARAVQDYCRTLGVPCVVQEVDVPAYARAQHMGVEQAARELRYAFFDRMLAEGKVDCVATAHHLDDQTESTMLHILRGSGLNGLRAMGKRARYIYPFLSFTRAQIQTYAERYAVPYREDATNADPAYNRNFLRLEVLPLVESRFPQYRQSLAKLTEIAEEQASLLDELAIKSSVSKGVIYLPTAAFSQHPALAKWSVADALRHFNHGIDMETKHYQAVLSLIDRNNNDAVCLPHGVKASLEYDQVVFWQDAPLSDVSYPFGEGTFAFGEKRFVVRPYREGDRLRFDPDKLAEGAEIRLRRAGDRIEKFGGGTKSLGDFYTDKKIPLRIRDAFPVIAAAQNIAVCAADIARSVAVSGETRRVYTLTEED